MTQENQQGIWLPLPGEATHADMRTYVNDGLMNIMSLDGKTLLFSVSCMVMINVEAFQQEGEALRDILSRELPDLINSHLVPKH